MKILVTGGAGFIGSHLVERLVDDGHEVTVIDCSQENIENNLHQVKDKIKIIKASITDKFATNGEQDVIVHLAAIADIVPSIQDPLTYYHHNVTGTLNVLQSARTLKVKKFIYAASGSCYGDKAPVPTTEDAPINPKYPYALTKWMGEEAALHWHKVYGLPVTSLRFFNVYGPRSRTTGAYGAVFGVFLAQKANKKPYTIVGNGHQSRDFTYVSDAVEGIVRAISASAEGKVYNIASGHHISINYLVDLLDSSENGRIHLPKRPGEPDITLASISRAIKDLQYNPRVSFVNGVKKMLENIGLWVKAPVWDEIKIKDATKDWFKYLGDKNARQL